MPCALPSSPRRVTGRRWAAPEQAALRLHAEPAPERPRQADVLQDASALLDPRAHSAARTARRGSQPSGRMSQRPGSVNDP